MKTNRLLAAPLQTAALVATVLAFVACGRGAVLRPIEDGTAVERRIGDYLTAKGLENELIKTQSPGDSVLMLVLHGEPGKPDVVIILDTQTSARNKETLEAVEQVILLQLRSEVKVPVDRRGQILRLLNAHHNEFWAGRFSIDDDDGELHGSWAINLSRDYDTPIEVVEDAMVRLVASWLELQPKLAKQLAGAVEPEPAADRPSAHNMR